MIFYIEDPKLFTQLGVFILHFYFIATPNHFIISLSSQPLRVA